jgi:hypothetical protein
MGRNKYNLLICFRSQVDQRKRHRSCVYLPLGRGAAYLVGQRLVFPDRFDGCSGHCG